MIRAVLFDLDGTLLDRDASVKKFIEFQYHRLHKWVGHVAKNVYIKRFIELDGRGYVWKDKVYRQLIQEFNITDITWEELLEDYLENFKSCCVPFPNLIRSIEELKRQNVLLGIITNGFGQFQMDNIRALGIEKYFETLLVSEWEGLKKPDPRIFHRALRKLGVEANECLFVGDHPINDVKAAQEVGMRGIWKRDEYWDKSINADYIVEGLAEIPLILEQQCHL
ncbi:HAD family hydrolase [Bacillus carboniphilus]|uniref:HAD family hydrolase n=1 Tax=Bacillus carboniphilus TaxID=86663 RepID=A0ABP3GA40_9BACI